MPPNFMIKNYFSKNNTFQDFTTNHNPNYSNTTAKVNKNKIQSFVIFLSLFVLFFLGNEMNGQSALWSTGFESGDSVPILSNTNSSSFSTQTTGGNLAAGSVQITSPSTGNSKYYDGSVITNTALSLTTGKFYVVIVYAKASITAGVLRIVKSTNSTNAAMKASTGSDIILNPGSSYNVTSTGYVKYTAGFTVSSNEIKHIGFNLYSSGDGAQMILDDISIVEYDSVQPESYCTPTGNLNCTLVDDYISNVTLNTLNKNSLCSTGGYTNYSASATQTTSVTMGTTYALNITVGPGSGTHGAGVWFDFNNNGSFSDAGEFFLISNSITPNTTTSVPIPMPIVSSTRPVRMRIRYAWNITVVSGSGMSCNMSGSYGETEDYTITLVTPPPCVAPAAQPTALTLTPTSTTTITGSFILSSPLADNYLVVRNTSGIAPTLANGTSYAIGSTVPGGSNVVVDTDNNNTFTESSLTVSTTYYFFVFAYNVICSGGPLYYSTSPLNGSTSTLTFCPASSTASTFFISNFKTTGAIVDAPINSTSYSATGYGNYTANTPAEQIPGGGINISLELGGGVQYVKVWVDWNKNNVFDDPAEQTFSSSTAFISNTFGFVVPPGTAIGDYKMRIRSKKTDTTFTSCNNEPDGETEDYTIRVIQDCTAKITSAAIVERCGEGTVTLIVTGTAPTTSYKWYNAETGAAISGATSSNYTTPPLSITTTYYVTAVNGACESLTRKPIVAKIKPIPNITITPENPEICGDKTLLEISAAGSTEAVELFSENFEGTGLGGFTKINLATESLTTEWQQKTSVYTTTTVVWKPAISSGDSGNKFAFTTSDISGTGKSLAMVTTNNINTTGFTTLTLSFRHYFSYYGAGDSAIIEVSTNGSTWTPVRTYTSNQGSPGKFATVSIPLNTYVGNTTLKFRFKYDAGFCDGWAVDDILLSGIRPLTSSFTWTGATISAFTDVAASIPYTNQLVNKVYIKPSLAQLEASSWSFSANVQLTNGCTASKVINVTNTSKIWQNLSPDWNNPINWKPNGVPTSSNCVIIPNTSVIPGCNYNAFAKNLTIKSTGNLELPSTSTLTVTDFVNVEAGGTFNIRDKAGLIQINEINTNTGTINVHKTTTPFEKFDYTYWATPVTSTIINTTFPTWRTDYAFEFLPANFLDANNDGFDDDQNDWVNANTMIPGKGYIIMGPTTGTFSRSESVVFNGAVNNGIVKTKIFKTPGIPEDDDWNLVGNPYPSAISANAFINANLSSIDATLYFWTHMQDISISNPGPGLFNFSSDDYAMYNLTGGVGTGSFIGLTEQSNKPLGNIASCQSFFVESKVDNVDLIFNNLMRSGTTNTQFYKTLPIDIKDQKRDRLWLNLQNKDGIFSQQLIGYFANTTNDYDNGYDGLLNDGGNYVNFYSFINGDSYKIQGRETFNENDQVRLGYSSAVAGGFNINIDSKEGVFMDSNTNIYLEDKERNIIHDLKKAPYLFRTEIGDFDNRFILRYTDSDKTLGINSVEKSNDIMVVVNQKVTVQSPNELIKTIVVYDLLGRKIDSYQKVNAAQCTLNHLNKTTVGLILKITLESGTVISKKIIY
jgi:hypothetical protein